MTAAKILVYDLERSANQAYVWGKWQQDVIAYEREWEIISCAWKWKGQKKIHIVDMEGQDDDRNVVSALHSILDDADIAVTYNGHNFDNKLARTRMLYHGFTPPSPFKDVDVLAQVKRHFALNSNKLDDVCKYFGLPGKLDSGGFDTWYRAYVKQEPLAWLLMRRYNRRDVQILEQLYDLVLPWTDKQPNLALVEDRPAACPRCGQVEQTLQARGWMYYGVTKRRRFQCLVCGAWCCGRKVESSTGLYVPS